MQNYNSLIHRLKDKGVSKSEFVSILNKMDSSLDFDIYYQMLRFAGMPISEIEDRYFFSTKFTPIQEETFTIVDIETNGSKAPENQIIEIGAVKYRGGKILDKFESLIFSKDVPDYVTKLTNITAKDLEDAPQIEKVMLDFKLFLRDTTFVAHNVNFDYKFISIWFEKLELLEMLNRNLCTIELAKRTIKVEKFGLKTLKKYLDIKTQHHRALEDAISTTKIFEYILENVPDDVKSVEDLIDFSHK